MKVIIEFGGICALITGIKATYDIVNVATIFNRFYRSSLKKKIKLFMTANNTIGPKIVPKIALGNL